MIRNAYFVPDMLDQLIVEFQQYNKDGKWYTANEIRELIDVLERLRHCARVQSNQLDELQRDRKNMIVPLTQSNASPVNDNVIIFPTHHKFLPSKPPHNDGAA